MIVYYTLHSKYPHLKKRKKTYVCVQVPTEARSGFQISWSLLWVLGSERQSSSKTLNGGAISPASSLIVPSWEKLSVISMYFFLSWRGMEPRTLHM